MIYDQLTRFPTNAHDLKSYETLHEHVGEAQAVNANGGCDHAFLVLNRARNMCILPGRIDVALHYATHGGVEGFKEPLDNAL